MKQCKCGSYALNLHKEGLDQGNLCDRHYWQDRAEKAETLVEQCRVLLQQDLDWLLGVDITVPPELDEILAEIAAHHAR